MSKVLKIHLNNIQNEYHIGQEIKGEIVLIPEQDIEFKEFGLKLILEARGKLATVQKDIKIQRILENKMLFKGKTYTYPISFTNNKFETYLGINVSFRIKIETYGILSDSFINDTIKPFINPFNIFDPNNQWLKNKYIRFVSNSNEYTITKNHKKHIELENSLLNKNSLGVFILIFIAFIILITSETLFPLSFIPIFAFCSYALYLIVSEYLFGDFLVKLNQINNNVFESKCTSTKKWRFVKTANISYQIVEEVIDKRGSSDQTLLETRYKSEEIVHPNPNGIINGLHQFPDKKPASFTFNDQKIYWNIKLELKTMFKLKFIYNGTFHVNKIYK